MCFKLADFLTVSSSSCLLIYICCVSVVLLKLIDSFTTVSLQHYARPTSSVLLIHSVLNALASLQPPALHVSPECILSVLYLLLFYDRSDSAIACPPVQSSLYFCKSAHKSHQSPPFVTLNHPIQACS